MISSRRAKSLKRTFYGLVILGFASAAVWLLNPLVQETRAVEQPVKTFAGLRNTTDRRIETLRERLELQPSDSFGYVQLGGAYLQKARETGETQYFGGAEGSFLMALEIDSENSSAMTSMGTVALARHEFPTAMDWARQSLELNALNPDAYGVLADAQTELGLYDEATRSIQTMVDIRPNLGSYARVSNMRRLMGDVEGSIDVMKDAIDAARPGTEPAAWTRSQLGELFFDAGNIDEAAFQYEAAVRNFDNYYLALARLGKVRAAQGRYGEAILLLERAAEIVPQPVILVPLGDLYAKVGDLEAARLQYDTVEFIAKLDAINQQIYNRNLSLFYSNHDLKLDEALELAKSELVVRQDIYGYDALAWALHKNGRNDEAAKAIAEAMRFDTRDANLLYHAGMIHNRLGDAKLARELLGRALELNPNFSILQADVARRTLADLNKAVASSTINTRGGR